MFPMLHGAGGCATLLAVPHWWLCHTVGCIVLYRQRMPWLALMVSLGTSSQAAVGAMLLHQMLLCCRPAGSMRIWRPWVPLLTSLQVTHVCCYTAVLCDVTQVECCRPADWRAVGSTGSSGCRPADHLPAARRKHCACGSYSSWQRQQQQ